MLTILIVVLIIVLLGGGYWGYRSGSWGAPGGLIGLILIVVLVLALTGNLSS